MSLPGLYAVPQDDDDWRSWAFNHAANHYDWVFYAQKKTSTPLQQFDLSLDDPNELGLWLYNHQSAHDQVNAVLRTQGFNLLSLDWKDQEQFKVWLRLNGDEHVRVSAALGVG